MSRTLNRRVRDQILEERLKHNLPTRDSIVEMHLNTLTNSELLERISDALDSIMRELPTRLGI